MMEIQYDSRYVRDKYGNFLYRTNTTDTNTTRDGYFYQENNTEYEDYIQMVESGILIEKENKNEYKSRNETLI
jgi:hypothetical protein